MMRLSLFLTPLRFCNLLCLSLLLLSGCGTSTTTDTPRTSEVAPQSASSTELPPVFEQFAAFEPYINRSDDTVYVVNFWATWCAPCVAELPYFEALHQKYSNQNVKILLVSLDFKKHLDSKLKPFLADQQLQSEVLVLTDPDANSWIDKVSPDWSGVIPATLIYQKDKRAFYEKSFDNLEELEEVLAPFL